MHSDVLHLSSALRSLSGGLGTLRSPSNYGAAGGVVCTYHCIYSYVHPILPSCMAQETSATNCEIVLSSFQRILSSFAAKPVRSAAPCLVALEHILNSFAAKPIRIANLTLLPRDVCGYAHANLAPLPRNQRCHSQKPVVLRCSCFAARK